MPRSPTLPPLEDASNTEGFELVAIPDSFGIPADTIPFKEERAYAASTPWSISTQCECPELRDAVVQLYVH